MNRRQPILATYVYLLLAIAMPGLLAQAAQAQFTSPPGQGVPKGTAGGGSRPPRPSFCSVPPNSQETLLAMAPTQAIGLTSTANPTLWVYVPNTTATRLEFSLFTQEKEGVYQKILPVKRAGLLKISLPSNVTLAPDQPYYWTAALVCNAKRRTEDWLVGSWIQRRSLSADVQQQLAHIPREQRVPLYLRSGFWYEAFNTYVELQHTQAANSNDAALWADLLKAAGLSAMAIPPSASQAPP